MIARRGLRAENPRLAIIIRKHNILQNSFRYSFSIYFTTRIRPITTVVYEKRTIFDVILCIILL